MSLSTLPADASSLLVPVHLDAWVVDSQNQQSVAVYTADYMRLKSFKSPVPDTPDVSRPKPGVYLHWALPDALTHGKSSANDNSFIFPRIPNRWLVLRFNTPLKGQWQCKLWVVESDYLGTTLGVTAGKISGQNITSIPLAQGATEAVSAGTPLTIIDPNGSARPSLTVAKAVKAGDNSIAINAYNFPNPVTPGSTVQLVASSSYLNPFTPTSMKVAAGSSTTFNINTANIGRNYSIESWEANTDADGQTFLTAVGPGNIAFSAYTPFTRDVCSFTDNSLPAEGQGVFSYTYMVVGWYSNSGDDPMNGILAYKKDIWNSQDQWQAQTPAQRFCTLLQYYKWSVGVKCDTVATPPSTSLYHGLIASVQWPYSAGGDANIKDTSIAVGNTAADALATLVQAQANAEAQKDPKGADAWIAAGNTLASLVQAAMYDQLSEFGKPGSDVLLRQKIQQSWYGAQPGGTIWEVVSTMPQQPDDEAKGLELTPAQAAALNKQLAALNLQQSMHDEAVRQLHSQQESLYRMWMRVGMAGNFGWGEGPITTPTWDILGPFITNQIYPQLIQQVWDQYCIVQQADLPDATNDDAANKWINTHWTFPATSGSGTVTPGSLNIGIKSSNARRYWAPTDPVVMIAGVNRSRKFGEDGRYNKDKTLTCRLPTQTITGVQVSGKQITGAGLNLMPYGPYKTIPNIPALVKEAFFVDPTNADLMAGTVSGVPSATISAAITALLKGNGGDNKWLGTPPVPFAITLWQQAWSPLFLEWNLKYFPTGSGKGGAHRFSATDWTFDGEKYVWNGTGFDPTYVITYTGRTTLTPQASQLFSDKIEAYLKDHPDIDSAQMESLISTIAGWDILSQSLSGFTDQLITLRSQETFPPTPDNNMSVPCPGAGKPTPSVTALIGDQYHHIPMLQGTGSDVNYFYPIRGGIVQFSKLQVIDSYGQARILSNPNTSYGFLPLISPDLLPSVSPKGLPYGAFQLAPRVVQHTKLDMKLLSNDGSGKGINVSDDPSPICGWLLPNHLDGGISVYDENGVSLGELLPLPPPGNWRSRPGDPGNNPPPPQPSAIPNAALRSVVSSIASQPVTVFNDLLKVIDETLWMVDPLGGRKDQFLSVMIGRPLAVVQMSLQLQLEGDPATNQLWDKTAINSAQPGQPTKYTWLQDVGEVKDIPFPVRLGSLEQRNDGLIGYFLAEGDNNYKTFYSVHTSPEISPSDTYIRQIQNKTTYQGDISLKCNRDSVTVTMLIDPRGVVHGYTGVLPVTTATLPAHIIEDFIRHLKVTFITGPIIADPGTLRTPKPAEQHGEWNWVEAVPAPNNWEQNAIVNADDKARMPGGNLKLREGWLQLSDLDDNANKKS